VVGLFAGGAHLAPPRCTRRQREPVPRVLRGGLVGEPRLVERPHEEGAGAVAGKHPARPVGSVRSRREADHEEAGPRVAESRDGPAPVGLVAVGRLLSDRDPRAVLAQPRTAAAGDDLVRRLRSVTGQDEASVMNHEQKSHQQGVTSSEQRAMSKK